MEPAEALLDEAHWFARTLKANMPKDMTEDELRLRLHTYKPKVSIHGYACPKCWVRGGFKTQLRPGSGTDEYDILRCDSQACGAEIVIPFE